MGRRVVRLTASCNAVVLALGLAVLLNGFAAGPDVAFDGPAQPAAAPLTEGPPRLLDTGEDRPPVDPGARLVELPAHELDYLPPVLRTGVLAGDAQRDGGCVWIEMDGQPQAVRWVGGFRAGFVDDGTGGQTFELVDRSGGVVAREGEEVHFTGARSGGPERLERCHVGADHVWYVDGVSARAPILH
ncbi:MAG TPA: hypothetical protein VM324_02020 [Egibacteraceae bacterium]|jgi:hypothetical protein|nr:hypothetical protein [Egibacteraceae bacterium]